jgi:hypothetical protein
MKERILKNWTITRVLYLIMGVLIIVQSVSSKEWIGTILGAYFVSMGVFAFGCAAGNCYPTNYETKSIKSSTSAFENVEFEEVKM